MQFGQTHVGLDIVRKELDRAGEGNAFSLGVAQLAAQLDFVYEDLQFTGAGVTLTEERDLWDMPILLLILLGLVGAEWTFRRARGLV